MFCLRGSFGCACRDGGNFASADHVLGDSVRLRGDCWDDVGYDRIGGRCGSCCIHFSSDSGRGVNGVICKQNTTKYSVQMFIKYQHIMITI